MMKRDVAIIEKAFDELEQEGYFKDMEMEIRCLQSSASSKSFASSERASATMSSSREKTPGAVLADIHA